jgi:Uncharacterized conserved protein
MQLNEMSFERGLHPVEGYGPGFFRIRGEARPGPLLAHQGAEPAWAGLDDLAPLEALAGKVDVILFGMGAEIAYLPEDLRARLEALGLGCEVMASPAACRSYNVLLGEGRRVAVAALPVD